MRAVAALSHCVWLGRGSSEGLRGAEGMDTVYRYNELGRWLEHGQTDTVILSQLVVLCYCSCKKKKKKRRKK